MFNGELFLRCFRHQENFWTINKGVVWRGVVKYVVTAVCLVVDTLPMTLVTAVSCLAIGTSGVSCKWNGFKQCEYRGS